MLAFVDYGFIAAFFILLFGLVMVIAKAQTEEQAEQALAVQKQKALAPPKHVIEYGIIAALFGFFLFLTVVIERSQAQ